MSTLRLYLRVLGLLAPERVLTVTLALANLALAGVLYLEPMLFGRVVDALSHPAKHSLLLLIGAWVLVGLAGAGIGVSVSLHADKMAHRRRMAAIRRFFAHALILPMSYHASHHTGRLLRIMNIGTDNLFALWLGFFREHLTTLLSILVLLPLAFIAAKPEACETMVSERGRLVEQGRYDELIRRGGLFARLAGQGRFAPDRLRGDSEPQLDVAA